MTIAGFFSPTHLWQSNPAVTAVPLVDGFVYLAATQTHATLQFLVDSGADKTVLHPQDSLRLLPDESHWQIVRAMPSVPVGGAGAGLPHYIVPSVVILAHTDGDIESIPLDIWIAEPSQANLGHESLLGRDVLQHFTTSFQGLTVLSFEPLTDDFKATLAEAVGEG